MADVRLFRAFTGGKETWINIETITHMTASDQDGVIIHFIGGASTAVAGEIGAIIKDLTPQNRSTPRDQ